MLDFSRGCYSGIRLLLCLDVIRHARLVVLHSLAAPLLTLTPVAVSDGWTKQLT